MSGVRKDLAHLLVLRLSGGCLTVSLPTLLAKYRHERCRHVEDVHRMLCLPQPSLHGRTSSTAPWGTGPPQKAAEQHLPKLSRGLVKHHSLAHVNARIQQSHTDRFIGRHDLQSPATRVHRIKMNGTFQRAFFQRREVESDVHCGSLPAW